MTSNIEHIKSRLQFAIMLALFFPVTLQAVFALGQKVEEGNKIIIGWALVIVPLIISYLWLELGGETISSWARRWINIIFLTNIFSFVPVMYTTAVLLYRPIPIMWSYPFQAGFVAMLLLPVVAVVILVIDYATQLYVETGELGRIILQKEK